MPNKYTSDPTLDVESIKHDLRIEINNGGTPAPFTMEVNVKIPPKGNRRLDHHEFIHACEHARDTGHGESFHINGESHPFVVTCRRSKSSGFL